MSVEDLTAARFDVIVVGAGPAGAVAARELCRLGAGRVALLDKASFPRVKACGGGLSARSRRILESLGLWERIAPAVYPITGARIVSRSGRDFSLAGKEAAWVLRREQLDAVLVEAAVEAGVTLAAATRVTGLVEENGRAAGVRCRVPRQAAGDTETGAELEVRGRFVLLADGAGTLARGAASERDQLQTCMGWWEGVPVQDGLLEMYFDEAVVPHYAWLFPEPGGRVNIGLCVRPSARNGCGIKQLFDGVLARQLGSRLAGARQLGAWRGHPIPTRTRRAGTSWHGALLLGDAAGLANPATGEGISHAMKSGLLAARAVLEAAGDPGRAAAEYAQALAREMSWRLAGGRLFCGLGVHAIEPLSMLAASGLFQRGVQGLMRRL